MPEPFAPFDDPSEDWNASDWWNVPLVGMRAARRKAARVLDRGADIFAGRREVPKEDPRLEHQRAMNQSAKDLAAFQEEERARKAANPKFAPKRIIEDYPAAKSIFARERRIVTPSAATEPSEPSPSVDTSTMRGSPPPPIPLAFEGDLAQSTPRGWRDIAEAYRPIERTIETPSAVSEGRRPAAPPTDLSYPHWTGARTNGLLGEPVPDPVMDATGVPFTPRREPVASKKFAAAVNIGVPGGDTWREDAHAYQSLLDRIGAQRQESMRKASEMDEAQAEADPVGAARDPKRRTLLDAFRFGTSREAMGLPPDQQTTGTLIDRLYKPYRQDQAMQRAELLAQMQKARPPEEVAGAKRTAEEAAMQPHRTAEAAAEATERARAEAQEAALFERRRKEGWARDERIAAEEVAERNADEERKATERQVQAEATALNQKRAMYLRIAEMANDPSKLAAGIAALQNDPDPDPELLDSLQKIMNGRAADVKAELAAKMQAVKDRIAQGNRGLDIREQQGNRGLDIREQQGNRGLDIREQQGDRGLDIREQQGDRGLDIREQQGNRGLDLREQQGNRGLDIREQQGDRGLDIREQQGDRGLDIRERQGTQSRPLNPLFLMRVKNAQAELDSVLKFAANSPLAPAARAKVEAAEEAFNREWEAAHQGQVLPSQGRKKWWAPEEIDFYTSPEYNDLRAEAAKEEGMR